MYITGIGSALPSNRYTQRECWDAFSKCKAMDPLTSRSQAILKKVLLGDNGIDSRYLALSELPEAFELNPDSLHQRFLQHAPNLAVTAARRALKDAQLDHRDLDAVIISTCTGYLCPGLSSYVMEQLPLPGNLQAIDLVGQGCGAALPNLRTGVNLLKSGSCQNVLSICVEVCSAAFYLDNDPGVLISACLFGDGAGAIVLSHQPGAEKRRVKWVQAESVMVPEHRDQLRFEQRKGMLRNILAPTVPKLASHYAEQVLAMACKKMGLSPQEINAWIFHAGGREVLMALQQQLQLSAEDLDWSAGILRERGNISSPFVIHVLEEALAHETAGGYWWMSSFGAGFSCHGAMLEVE